MSKNNQSETKQILANALRETLTVKSFQKISVNELCEKSMIGRSTFYLHFRDKYELLTFCMDEIYSELLAAMKDTSPKDFLIVMLDKCQENEKIFYHIFQSEVNEELLEIFYQFFSKYLSEALEKKAAQGALLPGPVDSVTAFYVGGLTSMTLRWIKSNYKMPKETLASCQYRLLREIL